MNPAADQPPRVVIADDQTLVRGGFRLILSSAGLPVVAEASDGKEAVAAALLPGAFGYLYLPALAVIS